jgi:PAS domain S-box-containing protein
MFMVRKANKTINRLRSFFQRIPQVTRFYSICLHFITNLRNNSKIFNFIKTFQELQRLCLAIETNQPLPAVTSPDLQKIAAQLVHFQHALGQTQDSFYQIFNANCLPLLLINCADQKIATVNPALLELTATALEDLLGRCPYRTKIGIFKAHYQQLVQIYQRNKGIHNLEITITNYKRKQLTGIINANPVTLNDNKYVLISYSDISDYKAFEAQLRESTEYYQEILQNVSDIFFILDGQACFTFANDLTPFLLSHKPEELLGEEIWGIFPSLVDTPFHRKYLHTVSAKVVSHFQAQSFFGDQWYNISIYPLKQGVAVFGRNITSQKQIIEALQRSNQQIGNILDSIPEVFFLLDHNWRFIYVNKQAEKYFERSGDILLGKRIWAVAPAMVGSQVAEHFHKAIAEKLPIYSEDPSPLSDKYFESHIYPSVNGLSVYMHDITERKQIEEVQAKAEERYSNILNNIGDPIFVLDHEWRLVYINQEMGRFFNAAPAETLLGKYIWDIQSGFTASTLYQQLCKAKQEKQAIRYEEYYQDAQSWIDFNIFYSASGLVACLRDISTRKKLEESSATERELLLITLRSIGDGVIAANRDGEVILINKTAEELTGWSFDEAIGLPLNKVFYVINDKTSEPYDNIVSQTIQSGETAQLSNAVLINRDFKEVTIANSCAPICSGKGEILGVVMVFQDITAKVKTEAELLKAHKIESIGVLAGGIAHDFNNFLAAILANIQLSVLRLEKGHDIRKSLNEAIDATKKASGLTKQLLTFAKGGAPVKKTVSITKLIEETAIFHLSGSKVKPFFYFPEDLWPVEVDSGQFSQVVSNLVINAEQAMPQGGVIEVNAENVTLPDGMRFKAGRYVKIAFKDTGVGIAEEHLAKIFDPFYTTKHSGSGLGLTTSYSIITQHGGYIDLTTQLGVGTTFFIYLPASEITAENDAQSESLPIPGEGKILVMDDEAMIRNVVCKMLEILGYQATTAPDGMAALQLYQAAFNADLPFAAVIMDLTIPGGMGGMETLVALKKIDPQVRAIVSSGYANDPIMADPKKYGFCGVIRKPYKIEEFSQTLKKVLQSAEDQKAPQ